jgi:hypothetical protein
MAKAVETTTKNIEVKVGKAYNVYLDALHQLFNMIGGSLLFKLKIQKIKDALEAAVIIETQSLREAYDLLRLAIAERNKEAQEKKVQPIDSPEIMDIRKKIDNIQKEIFERTITINFTKIPQAILPSEEVLARNYAEERVDIETGNKTYKQGDYITLVAAIWDDLIQEEING